MPTLVEPEASVSVDQVNLETRLARIIGVEADIIPQIAFHILEWQLRSDSDRRTILSLNSEEQKLLKRIKSIKPRNLNFLPQIDTLQARILEPISIPTIQRMARALDKPMEDVYPIALDTLNDFVFAQTTREAIVSMHRREWRIFEGYDYIGRPIPFDRLTKYMESEKILTPSDTLPQTFQPAA